MNSHGLLPNRQEIAVKRQYQTSREGAQEFKNEMVLVAKLQHRNIVKLLGFCLRGEEKILIYEFVPNKSLDYFYSCTDPQEREKLDWSRRYKNLHFELLLVRINSQKGPRIWDERRLSIKVAKRNGGVSWQVIAAIVALIGVVLMLFLAGFCFLTKMAKKKYNSVEEDLDNVGDDILKVQSLQYDLGTIEAATNNFSNDNKIGEGEFGLVYKGLLSDGQEVAVKRVFQTSEQFKVYENSRIT
ncbi:hypothetical protein RHMOL_Rhmol13G0209500 [Rhododendron molle]|uniref:Uncharacterized protein n=1 Tax=Rhododendron molle TaxID=49168 RepID=A0ACC0L9E8_RHOML|nr:hypothetical protein RHMOL_Rhmol13G0209500 [Rhododendron molle]